MEFMLYIIPENIELYPIWVIANYYIYLCMGHLIVIISVEIDKLAHKIIIITVSPVVVVMITTSTTKKRTATTTMIMNGDCNDNNNNNNNNSNNYNNNNTNNSYDNYNYCFSFLFAATVQIEGTSPRVILESVGSTEVCAMMTNAQAGDSLTFKIQTIESTAVGKIH